MGRLVLKKDFVTNPFFFFLPNFRWRELEMTQQIRTIAQQNQLTLSIYGLFIRILLLVLLLVVVLYLHTSLF